LRSIKAAPPKIAVIMIWPSRKAVDHDLQVMIDSALVSYGGLSVRA